MKTARLIIVTIVLLAASIAGNSPIGTTTIAQVNNAQSNALPTAPFMTLTPPTDSTLNVRAFIDGRSHLIVQGNTIYWHHLDYAAPGRHFEAPGGNVPTYLNGTEWCPSWPGDPPDLEPCAPVNNESRDCDCDSSSFVGVPSLATRPQIVTLDVIQARADVTIVQQPNASNGFTLIVEFNDNSLSGPDWYEIALAYGPQPGKIIVNNDEWTLSDEGFPPSQDTDAAQFARNMAHWFTVGRPGNFLVYSTPFGSTDGLVGDQLANTMITAGHAWTVISTTTSFSLDELLPYDGIFLAGSQADNFESPPPVIPPDTQLLINYVEAGGNVYLAGGTDPDLPQQEAEQWNPFLNACGLEFEAPQNDIARILQFNSSHPIFAGVQKLYQRDGNSIHKLDPSSPNAVILIQSKQGEGLYAVCSIGAPVEGIPTAIDLLSFTAKAGLDHVTLAWQTGTEVDNAGFNLYRATTEDGPYTQLNDALIPAQGDPISGDSYTYTDNNVTKGVTYYYKLEDVDIHGLSAFHGPVSATLSAIQRIYLPFVRK